MLHLNWRVTMKYVINNKLSIRDYEDKIEIQQNDIFTKINKQDILNISKNKEYGIAVENLINEKLVEDAKTKINDIMNCYVK